MQAEQYPFMRRLWFRLTLIAIAIGITFSPIYGLVSVYLENQTYKLSTKETSLLSRSTVNTKYIKETEKAITYNRADEQSSDDLQQVMKLAASKMDATGKQPYQAELFKDSKEGLTFSDSEGKRSVTLKPQFGTGDARLADDRVVYPANTNERHVYSFKANGIKSDIVLAEAPQNDTKTYEWQLKLDKTIEARLHPDGGIGIYSADPRLYADTQAGDGKTEQLLIKAQEKSDKTNLVYEIPKPFILDAKNQTRYDDVAYALKGNTLTLTAKNLDKQSYPLTIDPTIIVTTTSDFQQKTGNTGNIDSSTADQISRASAAGGALGAPTINATGLNPAPTETVLGDFNGTFPGTGWTTGGNANWVADTTTKQEGSAAARNGVIADSETTWIDYNYTAPADGFLRFWWKVSSEESFDFLLFCIDNDTCTNGAVDYYAKISGDVTWAEVSLAVTSGAHSFRWLYTKDGSGTDFTDQAWIDNVRFAPGNGRNSHTSVAYNGYLYIIGGQHPGSDTSCNGTASLYCSDIQYCPINGNGSIGACTTQAGAFVTERSEHTSVIHNGFLYIIGGTNGTYQNNIRICPINSGGPVGACNVITSGSFTTARAGHTSVVYNGYLYIIGGVHATSDTACNGTASIYCSDIQYCPINADGSLGTCNSAGSFTTARSQHTSVVYNGYLYVIGGYNGSYQNGIQYCAFNPDGTVGTCNSAGTFTTARGGHTTVVNNGYLYIIGGTNGTIQSGAQNCPINANGTVGVCLQQSIGLNAARTDHASVLYNGFLYSICGNGNANEIRYAPVNLSAQSEIQTSKLSLPRIGQTTVAYNGWLYVLGGGNTLSYRDIDYCPINTDGSIGTCLNKVNAFASVRESFTSVVYNGYLYIIGGRNNNNSAYYNDIQWCPLAAAGTVGACTPLASAFPAPRSDHSTVAYNGYLYIIGGAQVNSDTACHSSASSICSDILYCPVSAIDGSVTVCSKAGTLLNPTSGHSSFIYNSYLYTFGGSDDTFTSSTIIQRCPITTGGQVGPCASQANTYSPAYTERSYAFVDNGTLYFLNDNTIDLQRCPINANGTIGTCIADTNVFVNGGGGASTYYNGFLYHTGGGLSNYDIQYKQILPRDPGVVASGALSGTLISARDLHSSAVDSANGYVYNTGGRDAGTAYYRDIQRCTLTTSGGASACTGTTLGQFGSAGAERRSHASVVHNNYLYIMGGNNATVSFNDLYYCQISLNDISSCTQQTAAFPGERNNFGAFTYNNKMYLVGGSANGIKLNDIVVCDIISGSGLSACRQQFNAFTWARANHSVEMYNGNLYIIGGEDVANNTFRDIQRCPILENGSVGNCIQQINALPIPRRSATTAVYNGYLYLFGGYFNAGSDLFDDIMVCPIYESGEVGNCMVKMAGLPSTRYSASMVVYNGYAFLMGGQITSTPTYTNTMYSFDLHNSMPKTARYERTIDTGSSGNTVNSFVIDGTVPTGCSYTVTYRTAASITYASATTLTGVLPGVPQSITAASKRYVFMAVTLDDIACGDQSTITSISLTYNGAPDAPTLLQPANAATGVAILPEFRLGSTDDSNDYLRYTIDVCTNSGCSLFARSNIDQSVSQIGWLAQSVQSGTAYTGGLPLTQYAVHKYQPSALSPNTQYWWRAKAIDPGGSNQTSAYSGINTFTTGALTPSQIIINGGTTINGNTRFSTGNN